MYDYFLRTSCPVIEFGKPTNFDFEFFLSTLNPETQKSISVIQQILSSQINSLKDYLLDEVANAKGFLKNWLLEELQIRFNLTFLRSRKMNLPFSSDFEPDLKLIELFHLHENEPLNFARELLLYRFNRVEILIGLEVFTPDAELAYATLFILNDQWMRIYER